MLHHRSFKGAKCKTSLKLAVSRIKVLKNKREGHLKQLRTELATLLHCGHNHTARLRVEDVVMEEKTMAAYGLIEIYCELIATRLPMIESQRNCPNDLKEAISSIIFASPRCLDVPELMDVRKHITAKYGREFVSAAVELRPDCGVNRLLVEKLSTKAPDGPTKIKMLISIAEEHDVKWKPSLEENNEKASDDLLAGPDTFERATYVEPPQLLHFPPAVDDEGPPNLPAFYQHKEIRKISKISYKKNASLNSSGTGSQAMNFGNLYFENMSSFQMDRQNWSMEFKDVASAAQAAAESAERASVAARAAAELCNREKSTRQCSSEWESSSAAELPQEYACHAAKHRSNGYVNDTYRRSIFEIHNEQTNVREQLNLVVSPNEHYINNSNENMVKSYQKVQGEADKKSSTRDSNEYSDGVPMKNSVTLASRILVPSKSSTCSSLKGEASQNSGTGLGGKCSWVSYESNNQKVPFKDNWTSSEHGSAEHAPSKPGSETKSEDIIILSARVQGQPSTFLTKTTIPEKEEASKSNKDKEKASHVHPKLPDYDTFAAQFLSRKNCR